MNTKNKFKVNLIIILLLAVFLPIGLHAQAGLGKGRLSGTVVDEIGKPVANATITLEFEKSGKKFKATSDQKGEWALLGLGTGRCNVIAMANGFLPSILQVNVFQLKPNPLVNFVLKIDPVKFVLKINPEKKNILLRIFTVIASKEGKSDTIENKDLKRVLAEVSNLLSFKSYVLDGASMINLKDGTRRGNLTLSSTMLEPLMLYINQIEILTGSNGKRSVKLSFWLLQARSGQELLSSETEIAENGYLVAGVSRIGNDGKSLVLVINAEIK